MQPLALGGGFADAPVDAAISFRHIMTAMARPGDIEEITGATPPEPLSVAAGCVVLCLCDPDTPLFLAPSCDTPSVRDWISFHTGAPIVDKEFAQFAIGRWEELPLDSFRKGTPEYPDRSATLIVECSVLAAEGAQLSGPGIQNTASLSLPETEAFQRNASLFPLGLDFLFTSGNQIAALPRTTKVF